MQLQIYYNFENCRVHILICILKVVHISIKFILQRNFYGLLHVSYHNLINIFTRYISKHTLFFYICAMLNSVIEKKYVAVKHCVNYVIK